MILNFENKWQYSNDDDDDNNDDNNNDNNNNNNNNNNNYNYNNNDDNNYNNNDDNAGHDVNFCSDLPRRASEIQFSLALLQLSLALEKLYVL